MKNHIFRRSSIIAGGLLVTGAALSQGCLQRDVKKQNPNTSNIFVEQIANAAINEIDLLFVIDNSVSMADKQEILVNAVPEMVGRLVNPGCVNNDNEEDTQPATDGDCATGYSREFQPIDNIHIGVISSSLGGHGSTSCPRNDGEWNNDDRGRLIPTMRPNDNIPMTDPAGFLAWTGAPQSSEDLINDFKAQVAGVGEIGCGFEAPLEAWYRFLVDPQPPEQIVVFENKGTMITDEAGTPLVDGTLLQQRAAFLRPEGLVAIVVLTDENDCSIMDGGDHYNNAGFGWLVAEHLRPMKIATPMCDTNPNDECCFSCLQRGSPPSGCGYDMASICNYDGTADPPQAPELAVDQDRANVRCFQNKRRFGVDLLYPTQRYVDALTLGEIIDARTGATVDNPLLRGAGFDDAPAGTPDNRHTHRPPGLVFFAGIIGIPWQDIATDASLNDPKTMAYLTADDLLLKLDVNGAQVTRWDIILGQPGLAESEKRCADSEPPCGNVPGLPLDPFMIESIAERTPGAVNPISGDMIVASTSNNPRENNINGHEANHAILAVDGPMNNDLQYACTFPLETPKPDCQVGQLSCDCSDEGEAPFRNRPLCQPPSGGAAGTTQYYGKAYPGTRILQVLRDFGENSIVGSICPKISLTEQVGGNLSNPNYGYNPAVQAIVDRLKDKLSVKCLPRELSINDDGSVPCSVVEAKPPSDPSDPNDVPLDCGANNRDVVDEATRPAVLKQLEASGRCGEGTDTTCDSYQMCTIRELLDDGRDICLHNSDVPPSDGTFFTNAGFCYIDPTKQDEDGKYIAGGGDDGTNALVDNCAATERRLLRFVGADTPAPNTITFVACTGDAASEDAPIPAPAREGMGGGGM